VAEKTLYEANINALFEQECGAGVAQHVWRYVTNAGALCGERNLLSDVLGAGWRTARGEKKRIVK